MHKQLQVSAALSIVIENHYPSFFPHIFQMLAAWRFIEVRLIFDQLLEADGEK
jgi:hypothetical protein